MKKPKDYKFEGWAVGTDHLARNASESSVGIGMTPEEAAETSGGDDPFTARTVTVRNDLAPDEVIRPVRFQSLDDDDILYYDGMVTSDWVVGVNEEAGLTAYTIDRWAAAEAGAVKTRFAAEDLPAALVERHRGIGCVKEIEGTEWVTVYG